MMYPVETASLALAHSGAEKRRGSALQRRRKAEHVLSAATVVFLRDGYEAASMDSIAREAKSSKGTLYAHFADKKALFSAVVSRSCRGYAQLFERDSTEILDVSAVLRRFGIRYAELLARRDVIDLYRSVVSAGHRFPEIGQLFYEAGPLRVRRLLSEFLARAATKGELGQLNPEMAAELFSSMICGGILLRVELGIAPLNQEEKNALINAAVDMCLSGCSAMGSTGSVAG